MEMLFSDLQFCTHAIKALFDPIQLLSLLFKHFDCFDTSALTLFT